VVCLCRNRARSRLGSRGDQHCLAEVKLDGVLEHSAGGREEMTSAGSARSRRQRNTPVKVKLSSLAYAGPPKLAMPPLDMRQGSDTHLYSTLASSSHHLTAELIALN